MDIIRHDLLSVTASYLEIPALVLAEWSVAAFNLIPSGTATSTYGAMLATVYMNNCMIAV
jgi:hypothetical protein